MIVYNYNGWIFETNNQSWQRAALCAALSEDWRHSDVVHPFHMFTVSHISPFIYHCQTLFRSNTSVWCLLDVSSNDFLRKHNFDHFDLILFKRLPCEILFYNSVNLLLDRITYSEFGDISNSIIKYLIDKFKTMKWVHDRGWYMTCQVVVMPEKENKIIPLIEAMRTTISSHCLASQVQIAYTWTYLTMWETKFPCCIHIFQELKLPDDDDDKKLRKIVIVFLITFSSPNRHGFI